MLKYYNSFKFGDTCQMNLHGKLQHDVYRHKLIVYLAWFLLQKSVKTDKNYGTTSNIISADSV